MSCNLCSKTITSPLSESRVQKIKICRSCKFLEDTLCELIETQELEKYISFGELIIYCDMLRNDLLVKDRKELTLKEYMFIMED